MLLNILLSGMGSFPLFKRKRVLITEKCNGDENQIGRHKGEDIITSKGSKAEIQRSTQTQRTTAEFSPAVFVPTPFKAVYLS